MTPTIKELEAILNDPRLVHIQQMPDGSIRAYRDYPGEFVAPKILTFEEAVDVIAGAT